MKKDEEKVEEVKRSVEMIGDVKVIRFEAENDEDDEMLEAYKAFRKSGRIRGCK